MISASASNDQLAGSESILWVTTSIKNKTAKQKKKRKHVWVLVLFDEIFVSAISVSPCLYIQMSISLYFRVYMIFYLVAMEKVTKLSFLSFNSVSLNCLLWADCWSHLLFRQLYLDNLRNRNPALNAPGRSACPLITPRRLPLTGLEFCHDLFRSIADSKLSSVSASITLLIFVFQRRSTVPGTY